MSAAREINVTDSPRLDLSRTGTAESAWRDALDRLHPYQLPAKRRVVVISPHPDDETFGVGGIIAMLLAAGESVVLVSVTDGEAASTEQHLAARRHQELRQSLLRLGHGNDVDVRRWGLPDSRVATRVATLANRLFELLRAGDIVLAPLETDGHGDHDAIGNVTRMVTTGLGVEHWSYPIWAWHWHDPETSPIARHGVRVQLSAAAAEAKRQAMGCFVSQITGNDPVVRADMVERFSRPFEVLVRQ